MTKQEYQSKLLKILESMIGEEVIHDEFGLGTIIGFEENECIVKYERFDNAKMMSSERFFQYNEPVSQSTIDDINELKCEYELTNKKNKIRKEIINEQTIKSEKCILKSKNGVTFDDVIWSVVVPITYKLGVNTKFVDAQFGLYEPLSGLYICDFARFEPIYPVKVKASL